MIELLVATKNKGKLKEIKAHLVDLPFKVTSLADYSGMPEIIEDGKTFEQNALKKAVTIAMFTGKLTMGEDSGLQVSALSNAPGIYSARFSGEGATDKKNNCKLLRSLKGKPLDERGARYRCCVALVDRGGIISVVHGACSGVIAEKSKGRNGFGYDPLFIVKRYQKTFGELDPSIKLKISHRARALKKVRAVLAERVISS